MIALDVYFTAKAGESAALEKAIVDVWMETMQRQPGFLRAAMNTPFPDEELEALAAAKPAYTHGVVSFWESEERRLEWVARDIHQEVWPQVLQHAESVAYTLFNCPKTWNIQ